MINAPDKTYTISDFISMKNSDSITYHHFALLTQSILDDSIIYSHDNIIYTYLDELKNASQNITMSVEEFNRYQYKPKLLSYALYGTTEAYFILLAINGMCNVKDFNTRNIKALEPSVFFTLINEIYNAELEYINLNRSNIKE